MLKYKSLIAGLALFSFAVLGNPAASSPAGIDLLPFAGTGLIIADQGNRALRTIRDEARAELAKLDLSSREVSSDFAGPPMALAIPPRATDAAGGDAAASARSSQ